MASNNWTTHKDLNNAINSLIIMDTQLLQKIGLSKAEITVYLALLQLGSVGSGKIVHEANLRKSTVYDSIKRLQQKGLVSSIIKNGMKHFEAAQAERIIDFINEKKQILQQTEVEAKLLVQQLKKGFNFLKPHAEAHVFEGIEGFKTIRRDMLKHAQGEILLIGAISREDEVIPGFFKEWNQLRQRKKIKLKILHKMSVHEKVLAKKDSMGKYYENKFLPSQIESPAVINIYGERVVNVLWKNHQPLCFLLINKEIADSYRKYFDYLWKISK